MPTSSPSNMRSFCSRWAPLRPTISGGRLTSDIEPAERPRQAPVGVEWNRRERENLDVDLVVVVDDDAGGDGQVVGAGAGLDVHLSERVDIDATAPDVAAGTVDTHGVGI